MEKPPRSDEILPSPEDENKICFHAKQSWPDTISVAPEHESRIGPHCKMYAVQVIGVGLSMNDLTAKHQTIIKDADLLIGGKRHLDHFLNQGVSCETMPITKDISHLIDTIKERMADTNIVVLASGDPLFSGIGGTLIDALGKAAVHIHPNISSVAGAFAAIKTPWHDATLISLHGKESPHLASVIRDNSKIAILTDRKRSPAWIANIIVKEKISDCRMIVLEHLGSPTENISIFDDLTVVERSDFRDPNIVILLRKPHLPPLANSNGRPTAESNGRPTAESNGRPTAESNGRPIAESNKRPIYPGMPCDLFQYQNGLITKPEVRAVTLSKLELIHGRHIFWDLGAGSGSVSIEVSRFIPRGQIYAVEKHKTRIMDINENIKRFDVQNMHIIEVTMPEGLADLPDPDRVFIGGGGAAIDEIIRIAGERVTPGGIMVINTVLLQSMTMAIDTLKQLGFQTEYIQMQVSSAKKMPFGERLDAQNPVWIITGKKRPSRAPNL